MMMNNLQQIDDDTLQLLLEEIGAVSSIYHKPGDTFITPTVGPKPIDEIGDDGVGLGDDDDDDDDDDDYEEEVEDDEDIFAEDAVGGVSGGEEEEEEPNFLF